MNWLDKAIDWISPQLGLKRTRARAIAKAILAYDGVRSDRRMGSWNTTGASGNSEIGSANSKLRYNARDLCRNNAYARKAKREWAKRVVGTGITPRPSTGNETLDKTILEYWNKWTRQCCSDSRINFYAAEKMIVQSCYESGEVLVRLWNRRPDDDLAVPFQIQVLESDYLDMDKTKTMDNGYIIHGIEFDPIGRIRGYWLYGQHPGEVTQTSWRRSLASKFIPASDVLHHAELDRPGDVRAVTRFAAVIAKLRDLDEYADAEIVRKKIEACLTAMVTQPEGAEGPTLGSAAVDSTGAKVEEFRPGMIMYGAAGAGVEFFSPTSSGDYAAHKKSELREVAVGLDIPYVVLDDNLEAVNYSSYRGGLLSFRDAIEEYRWNWLIPQVLDPIYCRFIETLFLMDVIPEANYTVQWDPPQFDLLDREAEAEADEIELRIGKTTYPQLVARSGYDADEQIAEIEKYKPMLDAAGISFSGTSKKAAAEKQGENSDANATPEQ
ncbi:MAG: phage portal protein [Acidobacteria bacterium]|nr:phage portal protein [Acidobacteriota bacterium]